MDELTSADRVFPDGLVLDSISGTAETVIKSWIGNIGLSISNPILGPLPCFFPTMLLCAYLFIVMSHFCKYLTYFLGFPDSSEGKELVR